MTTQKRLSSLSIFLPCYNEAENLPHMVEQCYRLMPSISEKHELIIVNDGSTDNTVQIINKLKKQYPHIIVVNHRKNLGYGMALRSGYAKASMDWIFFTDGDNQFNVEELTSFIPYTHSHNVIIGFRKKRAEGGLRAFNAQLFKRFIDLLFRLHVKDIDCAFKLIKADKVKQIKFHSTGAMISSELLYRLKKMHEPFKQIPVNHYPRKFGKPTGNNIKVIMKAGIEAVKLYVYMKFGITVA